MMNMETRRFDKKDVKEVAELLKNGQVVAFPTDTVFGLGDAFMPGAFTMILKKQETLPDYVTNGFPTVGIRMPDDPFVLRLIKECGKPLLVTSANRSGEETGVRDEQVLEQLDGRIDAIVLGEAKGKLASTIVDMSEEEPRIVREGPISADDIKKVLHNA